MELANKILGTLNNYLYSYILIALLVAAGVYFSVRTGLVQFRLLGHAVKLLAEKKTSQDAVSSFQALMISTASRVGTGNIAGVAAAIAAGGAGAVFWMWLIALIGSASAFVESTLAQVYKVKYGGGFRGGPSYYIERALGQRWLGVLFSIMLIACFAYGFNSLQANNMMASLSYYVEGGFRNFRVPVIVGAILASLTAYVIYGGQKKIALITSVIVPAMALIYMALGLFMISTNLGRVPAMLQNIFVHAFDLQSIFGGFTGSCVMLGIKRGLFSNEAGMGSAPNAAASADVTHPVKQGLVQMLSVFIDTILICSTTAFMILVSGVDPAGKQAMPLVQEAIGSRFGEAGVAFVTISVFFFGFSSIIGNYYYTESNLYFIQKKASSLLLFRISVVAAVFLGSLSGYDFAWNLADVLMGFMTVINIAAILLLGNTAIWVLCDYTGQYQRGEDPVFRARDVELHNTDFWK